MFVKTLARLPRFQIQFLKRQNGVTSHVCCIVLKEASADVSKGPRKTVKKVKLMSLRSCNFNRFSSFLVPQVTMKSHPSIVVVLSVLFSFRTVEADYASKCYSSSLPKLTSNSENRTIPWGKESFRMPNGTLCCGSLDQIRAGIDDVDSQLLELLAQRSAYGSFTDS